MKYIFVNLKRFDVPRIYGGICPNEDPVEWIRTVLEESHSLHLNSLQNAQLVYILPESLIATAIRSQKDEKIEVPIGCQAVYREDVRPTGNFGAFSTNRPASAMKALGCTWVMVGHSEERKGKIGLLARLDSHSAQNENGHADILRVVETELKEEVVCSFAQNLNVLLCVGETLEEKASETPLIYEPKVREVLKRQLLHSLQGVQLPLHSQLVIGYEPVWAIGPGKIPPNAAYIQFVSKWIKEVCKNELGLTVSVIYGGGLKKENAKEIAAIPSIDGGLVALTKFTPPVAFEVTGLNQIIQEYLQ